MCNGGISWNIRQIHALQIIPVKILSPFYPAKLRFREAFEPLSAAYGMPKSTPEEIEKKAEVIEAALVGACEVPLEIMRTCAEAIDLIETFAEKGSKIAISDAGVGATLLKSALQGASLNIYINTKSMADKEAAASYNKEADELREKYEQKADEIFNRVCSKIR